jgi:hypothetical protein
MNSAMITGSIAAKSIKETGVKQYFSLIFLFDKLRGFGASTQHQTRAKYSTIKRKRELISKTSKYEK